VARRERSDGLFYVNETMLAIFAINSYKDSITQTAQRTATFDPKRRVHMQFAITSQIPLRDCFKILCKTSKTTIGRINADEVCGRRFG
jgi:hypothetical protein